MYQYPISEIIDLVIDNLRKEVDYSDKQNGDVVCRKLNLEKAINAVAIQKQEHFDPSGRKWIFDTSSKYIKGPEGIVIGRVAGYTKFRHFGPR